MPARWPVAEMRLDAALIRRSWPPPIVDYTITVLLFYRVTLLPKKDTCFCVFGSATYLAQLLCLEH